MEEFDNILKDGLDALLEMIEAHVVQSDYVELLNTINGRSE